MLHHTVFLSPQCPPHVQVHLHNKSTYLYTTFLLGMISSVQSFFRCFPHFSATNSFPSGLQPKVAAASCESAEPHLGRKLQPQPGRSPLAVAAKFDLWPCVRSLHGFGGESCDLKKHSMESVGQSVSDRMGIDSNKIGPEIPIAPKF